jgi:CBS domain-containing protein
VQGIAKVKSIDNTTAAPSRAELRTEKARAVTRRDPAVVRPGTSLLEALEVMRSAGGDAVLVCDGARVMGILTERDVLTRVLGTDVDRGRPVDEFMTAGPQTLSADATLLEAMRAMESGHFRHVPLLEADGTLCGLLTQQDLLAYVAEAFPQEILNLPPRPHQNMEEPEGA